MSASTPAVEVDPGSAPAAPRRRLQQRIARNFASVVVVSLLIGGVVLLALRHTLLRQSMEASAGTFTALVALPVVEAANVFRSTGGTILEQRAGSWRSLNRDLETLRVVHVDGAVIMVSTRHGVETFVAGRPGPAVTDPALLQRIRDLDPSSERLPGPDGTVFRVVAPVVEEWGRHTYSVVADFSYRHVNRELAGTAWVLALVLGVGLILALRVSAGLAASITRGLDRLHSGVLRLHHGNLEERVMVDSDDEIQDLAEAFNAMADTLTESIERLREANRELEKLDQAKADLVANVSHELKTPLTALRGYLELLDQGNLGELPEAARGAVEVCQKNISRLSLRIEELVQLSRLERSFAAPPLLEAIHPANMLHGVVETLLPRLQDKGVICSLDLASDLPAILGSTEQLERVFLNLLDNARKFTPKGGYITVSARASSHDGEDGILVTVKDSGVGIPSRDLLRIFDRFYQVDTSSRRRHGGMGLGLSLVRNIVESHCGSVWAESQEGRGSTFSVWLPCVPVMAGAGDGAGTDATLEERPTPESTPSAVGPASADGSRR